ncbi:hypothetical protein GCM10009731_10510 [Streptomyces globosus]
MTEVHPAAGPSRRSFLTRLVAAPTLALVTHGAAEALAPHAAHAAVPSLPAPADLVDLGDLFILAGAPTAALLALAVDPDGTVRFRLPREEVGQGLTTAVAMLVAEELDTPLATVRVELDDARPELLFNQLTGSSNSVRSLYGPVRRTAATARARLLAAAARRWSVPVSSLTTAEGAVRAPDGRTAGFGSLSAAAADPALPVPAAAPKERKDHALVGRPTGRIDARAMVTGAQRYTLDLDVPGAKPCVVRRPPTLGGTVRSVHHRGLADGDRLHPVLEAWLEQDVSQCGFCQPGQIMAAVALLRRTAEPTDEDIDAIANICRCGTYPRIRDAIRSAAARM